jgi:hypothetical protein
MGNGVLASAVALAIACGADSGQKEEGRVMQAGMASSHDLLPPWSGPAQRRFDNPKAEAWGTEQRGGRSSPVPRGRPEILSYVHSPEA